MDIVDNMDLQQEISKTVGTPILDDDVRIGCRDVNVFYNKNVQAIFDVNIDVAKNQILAMIGPSGCGKSTLLVAESRHFCVVLIE